MDLLHYPIPRVVGVKIFIIFLKVFLTSCTPTELTPSNTRSSIATNDGTLDGKAFVYEDSPYILAGKNYGLNNVRMSSLMNDFPQFITENEDLTSNCVMLFFGTKVSIGNCIKSLSKESQTTPLKRKSDQTFIFAPDSAEFYQVNALYHINKGVKVFFDKLSFSYEMWPTDFLPKSIPIYLEDSKLFWFKALTGLDKKIFKNNFLTSYSHCELEGNASFSPAGPTLCFGKLKEYPGFYFVQDPSIIYHELGHAIISIMMNLRNGNGTDFHPLRSNLGSMGYSEAGAIGEGISDYFSFIMNSREEFGEFALGKTSKQSRPLSESSELHTIPGISETSSGRLSYPQFLLYDPNNPDEIYEDVHYAGQIVSHYLVALTKELKSNCENLDDHEDATSYVVLLLAETLSELGDLNPKNETIYFNNLDKENSYLWTQYNNPINFRRFFQTFARNINKYLSSCTSFDSEKLLDDYGLLLFKNYNDDGSSTKDSSKSYKTVFGYSTPTVPNKIDESKRIKSTLISKQMIDLAKRTNEKPDRVSFYIIDNASDMDAILKELIYKGVPVPLSSNAAGTKYNNNNLGISPGEILGLIPNLLNNSNSTIAGVQILATDWDHAQIKDSSSGNFSPCVLDDITTSDEGAVTGGTCGTTSTDYKRLVMDATTKKYSLDASAPVCMVLLEDAENSRWVSQNEFRKRNGISINDKDCLGHSTTTHTEKDFSFNPHECLVRFLPGGHDAFFSKIEPQKTFYESVVKETEGKSFNVGNLLLMEVNKWIPPGTKFRCRLRTRFSNCSDCYTEGSDDYIDSEYNGHKPFKIINFDFEVNE